MGAFHKAVLLLCLALVAGIAQAELPKNFQIILQTDNFPPFNMGPNNKHFARDAEVQGIGTDTVREIFKRAGIAYSLTLRSPWDRIYSQTLDDAGYGLFSVARTQQNQAQFKWVGPLARYESVLLAAPNTGISLTALSQAKAYSIGAQKSSGISQLLSSQLELRACSLAEAWSGRKDRHVGADAAAMVLSEAPYLRDEVTLLVDIGTNAEIILGNRSRLLAASSPTGPAFEQSNEETFEFSSKTHEKVDIVTVRFPISANLI